MAISAAAESGISFSETSECRVCDSPELKIVVSLGIQPLANSLTSAPLSDGDGAPLELARCGFCGAVQLSVDIAAGEMFSNYLWVTGTSPSSVSHCEWVSRQALLRSKGKPNSVLEIASNDGTLLKCFKEANLDVLGIDPAENLAADANSRGITTLSRFFSEEYSRELVRSRGKFDVVVARNVLSHVPEPGDLIQGMAHALSENGVAVIEFHRADIIVKELHYDSIYHEHSLYHSFETMLSLLERAGLEVFDALDSPISGGSWLIFASHASRGRTKEKIVEVIRQDEAEMNLNQAKTWTEFGRKVLAHKGEILAFLEKEAELSRRVMAFGASARSSTLLNFWGKENVPIEAIIDSNPLKQGLFSPGLGLPILSPELGLKEKPDTILLLAFNFREEIESLLSEQGWSGRLAYPLPVALHVTEFIGGRPRAK